MKKKISVCVPIKNEAVNIKNFYEKIINIFESVKYKYDFEIIFTDNDSSDESGNIIENICKNDPRVKYIKFRKDNGYEKSLELNYLYATGDALISIDCDFQDPPELILEFIKKWEEGYELVSGVRIEKNENTINLFIKKIFYKIIKKNAASSLTGDFRLISNKIKKYLSNNTNKDLFLRSFVNNINLKKTKIFYNRSKRISGKSKTNLFSNFKIILKALTYENNLIFQFISLINFIAFLMAAILASYYLIIKIFEFQNLPYGIASIHILVLSGIGVNGISFFIIFLYLKKVLMRGINDEVQIEKEINLDN